MSLIMSTAWAVRCDWPGCHTMFVGEEGPWWTDADWAHLECADDPTWLSLIDDRDEWVHLCPDHLRDVSYDPDDPDRQPGNAELIPYLLDAPPGMLPCRECEEGLLRLLHGRREPVAMPDRMVAAAADAMARLDAADGQPVDRRLMDAHYRRYAQAMLAAALTETEGASS